MIKVNKEIDYTDLCLFISNMAHMIKRLGISKFTDICIQDLENLKKEDKIKYAYTISLLEYYSKGKCKVDEKFKLPYYILEPYDIETYKTYKLPVYYIKALKEFRKHNILFTEVDEAVNETFDGSTLHLFK